MTIVAFTSVTANYLAKARVLASTLKDEHPEIAFHLVLAERSNPCRPSGEPFDEVADLRDLGLASRLDWIFGHSVVELCTSIKGSYTERLLARPEVETVLYFDPDIAILGSLDPILEALTSASIALTPHQIQPERDPEAVIDNEVCCLRHGVFNLGFLGLRNSEEGRRFAAWWSQRLLSHCRVDLANGIFTDQRWVDLAPALFDEIAVLRHPGLNVATWNFTHRTLRGTAPDGVLVNGEPLSFFHFSGFDGGAQLWMSIKYGQRMPVVFDLRNWYIEACALKGQAEVGELAWEFASYENGAPILDDHRRRYRSERELRERFPDPFATADPSRSYYHFLRTEEGAVRS